MNSGSTNRNVSRWVDTVCEFVIQKDTHQLNQVRMDRGSRKKPTLLIVEDDVDVADMLTAYFRVQGYDVLRGQLG